MHFLLTLFLLVSNSLYSYTLDPYEWLADETLPATQEWLADQKSKSQNYFDEHKLDDIETQLRKLMDFESVDSILKVKDKVFFAKNVKGKEQSCLFVRNSDGDELLVDPMTLPSQKIPSLTGFTVNRQVTLLAYGISESGSDWQTWHFKDLENHRDLNDELKGIKFVAPCWDVNGEGVYYAGCLGDQSTHSTVIYHHRLGTPQSHDIPLYKPASENWFPIHIYVTNDSRYLLIEIIQGASEDNGFYYQDLQAEKSTMNELIPVGLAQFQFGGYHEGRFYFSTDLDYQRGQIISIDPQFPEKNHWQQHMVEEQGFIDQFCLAGDYFAVASLHDTISRLTIYDLQGKFKHQIKLPGQGSVGNKLLRKTLVACDDQADFFYPYADYTRPISYYQCNPETGTSHPFFASEFSWNPEDFEMLQVFIPSKDSLMVIPLTLFYKKTTDISVCQPLILFGYGGFNVSLTPGFSASNLLWADLGGIFAVANIRGGGEYGKAWHEAGMREKKQRVFDDFITAAEWLITNKFTSREMLGITGRSNGGLLVGACVTQRPELFAAAVPQVGLYDMLNFHRYTVGWAWIKEYGDPDNMNDLAFLYQYSPYHHVLKAKYPPILLTTSDHDNRVVPLHSYKFAAMLQKNQQSENPILLRVYENAGHGPGRSVSQRILEESEILNFMYLHLMGKTVRK